MIEIRGIRKTYPDGTEALRGVSHRFSEHVTCILGRNGAGKTTLIRILSTQLLPTSGAAVVNGYDVVSQPGRVRGIISSIPQEAKPSGIATPMEHCMMYLSARGMGLSEAERESRRALKALDLTEVMDKPADELSGGTKRKLFVAMALASRAEIIFLDEPTTGLDPISRLEVWSAIKKLKSQVILTTHYMEEAKVLSDEVVLVEGGRIITHGTVAQLLAPFKGKVRIEGDGGRYRLGGLSFSYVDKAKAKRFVGKNVTIKPVDLEDIFVTRGIKVED